MSVALVTYKTTNLLSNSSNTKFCWYSLKIVDKYTSFVFIFMLTSKTKMLIYLNQDFTIEYWEPDFVT